MAFAHVIEGPCKVYYGGLTDYTPGSAEELCYNVDKIPMQWEPNYLPIYSDQYGGREGVPADWQLLGATASVQIESTFFNRTNCMLLTTFAPPDTAGAVEGTLPAIGSLFRTAQIPLTGYLKIISDQGENLGMNYLFDTAIVRQASIDVGTVHSVFRAVFECHITSDEVPALHKADDDLLT
jgi:hypothetical protein